MKRLAGKTALITGASSGIGRAIAKKFHEEGATLLLMDVTEEVVEGGEPTHKILNVPFFQGDVSSEADVEEAVRRAAQPTGRLDIVVNDAVVRSGKKLTDTSLEEWNRVMAVNVTGVFLMCRAAVRRMLAQEIQHEARGRIVNISSQHGMIASPRGLLLWRLEVGGRLPDTPDRRRLRQGQHHLQCRGAGEDPHRQGWTRRRAALDRLQPAPHAAVQARPLGGRRRRSTVPGLRRIDLHHG